MNTNYKHPTLHKMLIAMCVANGGTPETAAYVAKHHPNYERYTFARLATIIIHLPVEPVVPITDAEMREYYGTQTFKL